MDGELRKQKIGPGTEVGLLTVLHDSGSRKNGSVIWSCYCRCGNHANFSTQELHRVRDCGCGSTTSLIGQQFGRLTVIADLGTTPRGERGRSHLWKCRCSCGQEVTVTQEHLKKGMTKSCGCLRREAGAKNLGIVEGTSLRKMQTDRLSAANRSGHKGVYQQRSHGKLTGRWVAQIGFQGKNYFLGSYATVQEAVQARKKAEEQVYGGLLRQYGAAGQLGESHAPAALRTAEGCVERRSYVPSDRAVL